MSRNGTLHASLEDAIRSGKLPDRSPERTWAGPGCGGPCMICGQRINTDELEYELEFGRSDNQQPEGYHIHIGCFWAWETERQKLQIKQRTEPASGLSGDGAETRLAQDGWKISDGGGPT
jgi:hypothetical protein